MIRPAEPRDVPAILGLIHELAEYENLSHQVDATTEDLHDQLFGAIRSCEALVVEDAVVEDAPSALLGYALFFPTFSSFKARRCLHLEDLYITPEARGAGHGKALLATLAALARERGCQRLDWNVLSWNDPALAFYRNLGATVLSDWWLCRLEGEALGRVAERADRIP